LDIQAYISSGILEQYLLGDTTTAETADVERMAEQHPEVRAELGRIEMALEKYAVMYGTPPPAGTLTAVLDKVTPQTSSVPTAEKTVIRSGSGPTSWILGLIALIGIAAAIWFFFQQRNTQSSLEEIQANLQTLQEDCSEIQAQNDQLSRSLDVLSSQNTVPVRMEGTPNAPDALATVYFNPSDQVALLSAGSLPSPPSDMTYQLWALIDGNPVDMGIFEIDPASGDLISVPFIEGAQAFAVTLETAGGNPTPNLDQLFVIGNVG